MTGTPAAARPHLPAVDGELLSCYGAALAAYLDAIGGGWLPVLGSASPLDVRPEADGVLAFRHLPPGLRAAGGPLPLVRRASPSGAEALAGIGDELAAAGAVVVVGDAFDLPWLTAHGRRHAPHWFVVDGHDGGRWHVRDEFRASDDLGDQTPWSGWADDAQLRAWNRRVPDLTLPFLLQERHAFADEGEDDAHLHADHQWFAVRGPADPAPPPDPRPESWHSGPAALHALADHFERHGGREDGYVQADEIWTAARQRALHARHAEWRAGPAADPAEAAAAAALAESAADWARLPMMIRFARLSLLRPGEPRTGPLVAALRELAAADPN
ncbi:MULTISPECIES: hypothetical protein [Kitasatospora]|uniref:Butirosin biosynthesis protein H N-terminal domain-containing protein n=1 Tax=Kitasatospora setae (strain ATCC 33774 / DSM 43861 / JCM 3304 / KCC A-0304 / NBRC 14216 / KM-6054) TaxID=452652 RepID=E4N8H4_KITSK|nr:MULTISPECIES: hypothetical protein [Kitasatospora]BAJ27505.1 hypothetical protein KSE_16800 [Kitasatospora setae KM-6054]